MMMRLMMVMMTMLVMLVEVRFCHHLLLKENLIVNTFSLEFFGYI